MIDKAFLLGGALVGSYLVVMTMGKRGEKQDLEASDRDCAMRDDRRDQVQARLSAGFWKRAEKRLLGLGRLGESQRGRESGMNATAIQGVRKTVSGRSGTLRMLVCRRFEFVGSDPSMYFLAAVGQPSRFAAAAEATDTDFGDDGDKPIPAWPDVTGLLLLEWPWGEERADDGDVFVEYTGGTWRRPAMDDLVALGVL